MIYSLQTRNKLETRMIYLFSFVQNQSAASNEPHDPAWSQWTPWPPQWLLVDYLWLLSGHHFTQWILFAFVVVNEPTSDSEVYLHLCVVDISIWTTCDAYCELCVMPVMFIWVGYVIRDRIIKTGNIWSFCRVLHSIKRYFAEYLGKNTQQRGHVAKIYAF